jgi:hypothetical protein
VIISHNLFAGATCCYKHKNNYGKQDKQGNIDDCLGLFDGFHEIDVFDILMTGVSPKGWKINKINFGSACQDFTLIEALHGLYFRIRETYLLNNDSDPALAVTETFELLDFPILPVAWTIPCLASRVSFLSWLLMGEAILRLVFASYVISSE